MYIVVAALSAGITTAWLLPASWFAPALARATAGRVVFDDVNGSIWQGSAILLLTAADGSGAPTALPGRISFNTAFWPLLHGHVQAKIVDPDALDGPVTVDATAEQTQIGAMSVHLPANALLGLGAPFNTLALSGKLALTTTRLDFVAGEVRGTAALTLTDMASKLSPIRPLGSWRIAFDGGVRPAAIHVTTLSGPLNLSGDGSFDAGAFRFRGHASAAPGASANLADLLTILGPVDSEGAVLTFGN